MKTLVIFGTRPEAIKLAPLVRTLQARPESFETRVCVTAQHRQMLDQVLRFFEIRPDYDLDLMRPNQSLVGLAAEGLAGLNGVFQDFRPDHVIVQGDTTTTLIGALCAYYSKASISHIEAGLRSHNLQSPFPEEGNRILTGHVADFHFAPTERSRANLAAEGIVRNVHVVGNTVIDALHLGLDLIRRRGEEPFLEAFRFLDFSRPIVLVTGHRRESFGEPFQNFARALRLVAERFQHVQLVYPVHLNPNVRAPVESILGGVANVRLIEPLDYPDLIWLMNRSHSVVTDSGGIQEEAPSLGKPVLVTREVTERVEGIEAGTAKLVGTDTANIVRELSRLLEDESAYRAMSSRANPYGDGTSCRQIADILAGRPAQAVAARA